MGLYITCFLATVYFFAKGRSEETNTSLNLENAFLNDLLLESRKNYVLVDVGMDIACTHTTCEKYEATALKQTLNHRGWRSNVHRDYEYLDRVSSINAGSSSDDVVVMAVSQFSVKDQHTINLIRQYNAKSYIVIFTEEQSFDKVRSYILNNQIFNVYLVKKYQDVATIYEVCAFCRLGITDIKIDNSWKLSRGFQKEMKYVSSFKGEFYGASLRFGIALLPPAIFITGFKDGSPVYSGNELFFIQTLAKYLHFNIIIKPVKGGTCRNRKLRPIGYCKMLLEKQVDLAGFPIGITHSTFQFNDLTAVYYHFSHVIISANPPMEQQRSYILASVDSTVMMLIVLSFGTVTAVIWFIRKHWYKESKTTVLSSSFEMYSIMCRNPVVCSNIKFGQQAILGIWMLASFFVVSLVLGAVTSSIASPGHSRKPINSLEDMVQNDLSWIIPTKYITDYYLSQNKELAKLKKRRKRMKLKAGLDYVLKHPNDYIYYFAKVAADPVIRTFFWDGRGNNPFHFSPPIDGEPRGMLTPMVRKDSPFRDSISMKILQVNAAGLMDNKFFPDAMDYFGKNSKTKKSKAEEIFTSGGEGGIFVVVIFGFTISGLAVCIEIIIGKLKNKIKNKLF